MVWNVALTLRSGEASRIEMHVNAAEARRSLLKQVRRNGWRIHGSGNKGVLIKRSGGLSLIAASYEITA